MQPVVISAGSPRRETGCDALRIGRSTLPAQVPAQHFTFKSVLSPYIAYLMPKSYACLCAPAVCAHRCAVTDSVPRWGGNCYFLQFTS